MKIEIRDKNFDKSDALVDKVEETIGSLREYFPTIIGEDSKAHVDITRYQEKDGNHVRVTLTTNVGQIRADEKNDNLYKAIEAATDKLHIQLTKKKQTN